MSASAIPSPRKPTVSLSLTRRCHQRPAMLCSPSPTQTTLATSPANPSSLQRRGSDGDGTDALDIEGSVPVSQLPYISPAENPILFDTISGSLRRVAMRTSICSGASSAQQEIDALAMLADLNEFFTDPVQREERVATSLEGFPKGEKGKVSRDPIFLLQLEWCLQCGSENASPRDESVAASPVAWSRSDGDSVSCGSPTGYRGMMSVPQFVANLCADLVEARHLKCLIVHTTHMEQNCLFKLVYHGFEHMKFTHITHLVFSFCDLSSITLLPLVEWLATSFHARTLQSLDLSHNNISKDCMELLDKGICLSGHPLEFLSLRNNPIASDGTNALFNFLHRAVHLRGVDIAFCGLGDAAAVKLCNILHDSRALVHVAFDGARITQRVAVMLLNAVCESDTLLYLSLTYIYFCCSGPYRRRVERTLLRNRRAWAEQHTSQFPSPSHTRQQQQQLLHPIPLLRRPKLLPVFTSVKAPQYPSIDTEPPASAIPPESEDERICVEDDDPNGGNETNAWEWGALKRGYHKYTTNEPSSSSPKKQRYCISPRRAWGSLRPNERAFSDFELGM